MSLLDNPQISSLVNYAKGNGFVYDVYNVKYYIRINYNGEFVLIFQDKKHRPVIIDNDFHLDSKFGTEIKLDTFRTIFRKQSKGKG